MTGGKIRVFHPGGGSIKTAQTAGIKREELISSSDAWVGIAHTAPRFISGWHHHGNHDSFIYVTSGKIRLEFGHQGKEKCEGGLGDVLHVPRNTIHRESNPSDEEQVLFVVRVGNGEPVVNLEGPEG